MLPADDEPDKPPPPLILGPFPPPPPPLFEVLLLNNAVRNGDGECFGGGDSLGESGDELSAEKKQQNLIKKTIM